MVMFPADPHHPPAGQRLQGLLTKHQPVQVAPARRQQGSARALIGHITHAMVADSVSTQISTSQDLGLGVLRRELFVCGTRRPMLHCLGRREPMVRHGRDFQSQGPPPDPRHRTVLRRLRRGGGNNNNDRRGNDGGGRGGGSSRGVHFDDRNKGMLCRTDVVTHLSCNCGESDTNSTYRQCLVSPSDSPIFFTALTLFDTGAYTSFVNREVAKWLEQQRVGDGEAHGRNQTSSRHDIPTSVVGLAGTTMNSSVYGSVVFDLTLFNEVTRTDHVIRNIKASVIDSCIEVIVGLPDIPSHRLIHLIPSNFDTPDPTYLEPQSTSEGTNPRVPHESTTLSLLAPANKSTKNTAARSRGSVPCNKCSAFIAMGYDHTLCSVAGRPHTP